MAKLNSSYDSLQSSYVFRQVSDKTNDYIANNHDLPVLKLGIGNTSQPLAPSIIKAMHSAVEKLSQESTYTGYGDELGQENLRQRLADFYNTQYNLTLSADEFVLSDGAKSDTANLAGIFASGSTVAVQNPVYPVYVESNIVAGNNVVYLACNEANDFVPTPPKEKVDLIYICSPNNPTGTVATHKQLQDLVNYANDNQAVIVFDAAYSAFVRDTNLPRSIYEVPGAEECAIEVNSFSKWAGFCGVRLAWTIIPQKLTIEDTAPGEVLARWKRRQLIYFNGPSNIAQAGGIAALSETGQVECRAIIDYYLENAEFIKQSLAQSGLTVYGGGNSPYIWVKAPQNMTSWQLFDELLNKTGVVTTPGVGFGSEGEGYLRFSAFGSQETTHQAMERVAQLRF